MLNNDRELNISCRCSFEILRNALIAREKHDMLFFSNSHLTLYEKNEIINNWMLYIQKKMFESENINSYEDYISNKKLQNKYLETNFRSNIILSNLIRLINHPVLLKDNLKFFTINYGWRHIILITVSTTFDEYTKGSLDFIESKAILGILKSKRSFSNLYGDAFIIEIFKYWRILR